MDGQGLYLGGPAGVVLWLGRDGDTQKSVSQLFGRPVCRPVCWSVLGNAYDRWNNIPHYTPTAKYGRGPCKPSLTSYYARHS